MSFFAHLHQRNDVIFSFASAVYSCYVTLASSMQVITIKVILNTIYVDQMPCQTSVSAMQKYI